MKCSPLLIPHFFPTSYINYWKPFCLLMESKIIILIFLILFLAVFVPQYTGRQVLQTAFCGDGVIQPPETCDPGSPSTLVCPPYSYCHPTQCQCVSQSIPYWWRPTYSGPNEEPAPPYPPSLPGIPLGKAGSLVGNLPVVDTCTSITLPSGITPGHAGTLCKTGICSIGPYEGECMFNGEGCECRFSLSILSGIGGSSPTLCEHATLDPDNPTPAITCAYHYCPQGLGCEVTSDGKRCECRPLPVISLPEEDASSEY